MLVEGEQNKRCAGCFSAHVNLYKVQFHLQNDAFSKISHEEWLKMKCYTHLCAIVLQTDIRNKIKFIQVALDLQPFSQ